MTQLKTIHVIIQHFQQNIHLTAIYFYYFKVINMAEVLQFAFQI